MESKGMDAGKLSDLTDVPQRFIVSLVSGDFKNLPSEPYIRGYLFKVAGVLDADPNFLWRSFRQSSEIHSSGSADLLPANRFSLQRISSKKVWIVFIVLIVLGFLGFRVDSILGMPTLDVTLPETTTSQTINVTGKVNPGDTLTLNNEVVYPDERGQFEKEVQLETGLNTLEFRAKRFLGRETRIVKQVFYQPQ
ncbi:MAG: helix-turn-helix domain-containing protein [Candidatus Colwellbacteria bacterium]|nr:helix-turn-helix domain-containing protein [Candidatus Colwellbacteria bacterium]